MYTKNVKETSVYFTDSMFLYHNAPSYKIPNYNIEICMFHLLGRRTQGCIFSRNSAICFIPKRICQFSSFLTCSAGFTDWSYYDKKGRKNTENPPVTRVALKPIRRDMKPTSQSTNQENPCEERLSVCLSSGWREMVIFSVISIIPAPNRGGSNQAYTVWGDLVLWRGCAQRDKGVRSRPSSCCTVN